MKGWGPGANKYKNKRVVIDGISFASGVEGRRYSELRLLEKIGKISDLVAHPVYVLHVGDHKLGKIIPDFRYIEAGEVIVEDVKSPNTITPIFKWKAKHLEYEYGIVVRVVM